MYQSQVPTTSRPSTNHFESKTQIEMDSLI